GTLSTLIGGINVPQGIALDSTYAYVALESDDYLIKVQLSNGTIAAQLTGFQNNPYAVALDGTNVYFTSFATGGDVREVAQSATKQPGTALGNASLPVGVATDAVPGYSAASAAM